MDAAAIGSISLTVVSLTQLLKWSNAIPDRYGPVSVLLWSALGVLCWGWATDHLTKALAFDLASGWIVVALAAAGVYGFTRAGSEALTKMTAPPGGAGSSPTVKVDDDPVALADRIMGLDHENRLKVLTELEARRASRPIDPATPAATATLDALDLPEPGREGRG